MSRWMMVLVSGLMLTACGGSYTVTRTSAPAPRAMAAVALAPSPDNSTEMRGYMENAVVLEGLQLKRTLPAGERQSMDVDGVLTYDESWGWDIKTILSSLRMSLYDASTGALLVKGEWDRSFFHDYERGKDASRILLQQMLEKVRTP